MLIGPIGTYDNYSAAARTESKTALSCLSSFVSKKSGQTGDNIDILKKLNNLDSETISSDDPLAQKFKLLKTTNNDLQRLKRLADYASSDSISNSDRQSCEAEFEQIVGDINSLWSNNKKQLSNTEISELVQPAVILNATANSNAESAVSPSEEVGPESMMERLGLSGLNLETSESAKIASGQIDQDIVYVSNELNKIKTQEESKKLFVANQADDSDQSDIQKENAKKVLDLLKIEILENPAGAILSQSSDLSIDQSQHLISASSSSSTDSGRTLSQIDTAQKAVRL